MATPAPGSSASNIRPPAARVPGRLGSEEYHSAPLPIPQEAAVLYAANHAGPAAALLKAEIKDAAGRNNKQAWLMLFDLHQAAQNRADFDALSMLFTVKFEQSPPAWAESGTDAANDPRRAQSRERKDFFALKGDAGELEGEIDKFLAFAQAQGTVRLAAYHQGNHHRSIDSATGTLVTLHMTITVDGLLTVHVVSAAALTSEAARAVAVLCLGTVVRIVAHPEHPI